MGMMIDRSQWANLARMRALILFFEGHPGTFYDHRESGAWFKVSSEGHCLLQYSILIIILGRYFPSGPQWSPPFFWSVKEGMAFYISTTPG